MIWTRPTAVVFLGLPLAIACGSVGSGVPGDTNEAADDAGVLGSREDAAFQPGAPSKPATSDAGDAAAAPFQWPDPGPECVPTKNATHLSETCLYEDIATRKVRSDVVAFEPAAALWTDGAAKKRWIWLPPGTTIDTSDMDFWQFPVGTRAWKEFSLGGNALETRLIERTGPGKGDYRMISFVWRADGSDADAAPSGKDNVANTAHDVPSSTICTKCHDGEPGKVLGFSAIQLSHPGPGVTLSALATSGKLSQPPPPGVTYAAPGNPVQARALGYLHANCGHCHKPGGEAYALVNMILRLDVATVAAGDPTQAKAYTTTIHQATTALIWRQSDERVKPKEPESSDLWLRMGKRLDFFPPPNMPPYGTEKIDDEGRAAIAAWIRDL